MPRIEEPSKSEIYSTPPDPTKGSLKTPSKQIVRPQAPGPANASLVGRYVSRRPSEVAISMARGPLGSPELSGIPDSPNTPHDEERPFLSNALSSNYGALQVKTELTDASSAASSPAHGQDPGNQIETSPSAGGSEHPVPQIPGSGFNPLATDARSPREQIEFHPPSPPATPGISIGTFSFSQGQSSDNASQPKKQKFSCCNCVIV